MPECSRGFIHLSYSRSYFIFLQKRLLLASYITTMEFLLGDMILSFLGRAYLHLRFRKKERVQQELVKKYEGQYRNAGVVLLADVFMAFAVVALVAMIAAVLYSLVA